jgi:hypothetical protein
MKPRFLRQPIAHCAAVGGRAAAALLGVACATLAFAQPLPYSASVAQRFADPVTPYSTPGLAAGGNGTTSQAELVLWLQALAQPVLASATPAAPTQHSHAPPPPRLLQVGRSQLGQDILALHFSSTGASGASRPVVLLVAQQHGNEPAGAEALLVLAQQLAQGTLHTALQALDVVVLPRANPDGTAAGARTTATGHDMNRDHLLLHTPEARALAALVQRLQPLVVVDLHEYHALGRWVQSFGGEARHDMLLQMATTAYQEPAWQEATQAWLLQPAFQALAAQGLRSDWYHVNIIGTEGNDSHLQRPPAPEAPQTTPRRLRMGGIQTDVARNVYGLRHGASVLLESRGIGLGRLHLQRRVHSHLVAVHALLAAAAQHVQPLQALRERTRAEAAAQACQGMATVLATHTPGSRELLFIDPETGADKSLKVPWEDALQRTPVTQRTRPCGYWLAPDAEEAVQRLRQLGLQVQRLTQPVLLQTQSWVAQEPPPGADPTLWAPTNRVRRVAVNLQAHELAAPAGSWWLPLSQPLAALAMAALEPDTPSSYYANRVLQALSHAARVTAMPQLNGYPGPSAPAATRLSAPAAAQQRAQHTTDDLAPHR